jgi:hypothetical protein
VLFAYNKMARLFIPGMKFPHLVKENVEFDLLPDESMCIWDLTKEIGAETKIKELNDWKKIVPVAQKIWKAPTKTYNTGTHYNSGFYGGVGGTKSNGWEGSHSNANSTNAQTPGSKYTAPAAPKTTTPGEDDDDADGAAFIWNAKLGKYSKETALVGPDGAVEVNADTGKIKSDTKAEEQDTSLPEVDEKTAEGLICSPAKVTEHSPPTENQTAATTPAANTGTKTVNMSIDTEATVKAREYVEKGLEKFEDDEEVLDALNVEHAESLKSLPLFALANRIAKALAGKYFHDGYKARKEESGIKEVATGKIKTLKTITRLLGKALDSFKDNKVNKSLVKAIEEMPRAVKAIAPEDLTILTESDLKASPTIGALKGKIASLKKE